MSESTAESDPHVTESIANSVTHGIGLAASLVALPLLIANAAQNGDAIRLAGAIIYGLSLVVLFGTSTIYHSFATSPARPH